MELNRFDLVSSWAPSGDQPTAIETLASGITEGHRFQTLLGVTGSGKTFTMANIIQNVQRPTLVIAHNKTLAAQLYSELKGYFPQNAVNYFVSYYDYYQPEAYVTSQDLYIEKDASINDRIEKLRLATTKALLERRDTIVVASVSCIYGLGKRKAYEEAVFRFAVGQEIERKDFMKRLMDNYYERNDATLEPGLFRARGDILEIYPAYSDTALRIAFFDNEIERIDEIDPLTGKSTLSKKNGAIFPAQHYVTNREAITNALQIIERDMQEQVINFRAAGKHIEAQRIEMRTRYDMEMLSEVGYCSGIENYSRYLDGREPGEPPGTLLDFFPDDFLMIIDESHITIPQIKGMFNGDRARKQNLVDYGFRLPSCLDNRPLKWDEFLEFADPVLFVSATPGDWEQEISANVAEQIVRPTGVVDPEVFISPATGQIDDLIEKLRTVTEKGERALVTTLTKKSSEDIAEYLAELGLKVRYIHSELDTFERAELLRDLRAGTISVLVGVNLLREGIDLPEVSLVAILDADREGFLRSHRSLVQMIGRAARNAAGEVILYADHMTGSLENAVSETRRRRAIQVEFNRKHGITPRTIQKPVLHLLPEELLEPERERYGAKGTRDNVIEISPEILERRMWEAVEKLDFEEAARLRDLLAAHSQGGDLDRVAVNPGSRRKRAQPKKRRR